LIVFTIGIIALLWLLQVIFLDKFYENNKIKQIKDTTNNIVDSFTNDDINKFIDTLAYQKDACIEIFKDNKTLYVANYNKDCVTNTTSYKKDFIKSNTNNKTYRLNNPKYDSKTIIYASKVTDDIFIFVNASIEPLGETVAILSKQLVIVSFVVLILAFIVGYFISKKLSKPIEKITKEAKKMATGSYDIVFDNNSNIYEIDELADTLNHTKEELSKINDLQKELMANVSHDLKTPLTMIKGYAEMVRDLTYKDKNKRNENLNVIIEESDRLNNLVNDILTLSSVQSNKDLKIESFDLINLINQIIKRYEIYKETEGYKFILNVPDEVIIEADKKRIEQVIYNLINNAVNYTGEDNTIYVNVIVSEVIRIEIKDTGRGIDKDKLPFIWDKYYHSDNKHKRNIIGTGLGLSIVKNILENHKFNYGVISKKNKGTTFYFEINK